MKTNPWIGLPGEPPYVLGDDRAAIDRFNKGAAGKPHAIHLELFPEPFLGRPEAPIVLLGLNPGFDPRDEEHHRTTDFARLSRGNLAHTPTAFPFYLLDPTLRAPGTCWWEQRLGSILRARPREKVARSILCVEYFPYHSEKYRDLGRKGPLASQEYGFDLVRRAVGRNALVLFLRSQRLWETAVPELRDYKRKDALKSPQNPTVSPRNCSRFDEIVQVIDADEEKANQGVAGEPAAPSQARSSARR